MNISSMLKATMVAGALASGGAAAGIAGAAAAPSTSTTTTPSTTPATPATPANTPAPAPAQKSAPPKHGSGKGPCPNMGPGSPGSSAQGSHAGAGYAAPSAGVTYQ
jgi:hypothetical protein